MIILSEEGKRRNQGIKHSLELCARAPAAWQDRKLGIRWKCGQVSEGMDQMLEGGEQVS